MPVQKTRKSHPHSGHARSTSLALAVPHNSEDTQIAPTFRSSSVQGFVARGIGAKAGTPGNGAKASTPAVPGQPGIPGDPQVLFPPGRPFAWQKNFPGSRDEHVKRSLGQLSPPQTQHAAAWILNLVEAIHWASFPIGFFVAHYIYSHAALLAPAAPGGVYFIVLGLLCQVFGGGISGNMMHVYEGWQVTPFVNPLTLPDPGSRPPQPPPSPEWVDATRVTHFNNAWLRATAYQMLFTFQSLGLGFFSLAAFGTSAATVLLTAGTALVATLGPKTPRTSFYRTVQGERRPYLPLSVSLLAVFAVNVVVNLAANYVVFQGCMRSMISSLLVQFFGSAPALLLLPLTVLASVSGPLVIAAGGAVEGYLAETSFNQWHHFIAFVILTAGLLLELAMYMALVAAA